jgi:hypothetical protein
MANFWCLTPKIQSEFAWNVLDLLKKRKVTFRGCGPDYLNLAPDGTVRMWFSGNRKGLMWSGAIKLRALDLTTSIETAKPEMLANVIEEMIDESRARLDF